MSDIKASLILQTNYSGSITYNSQTHNNLTHRLIISHISQSYSQYVTLNEVFAYNSSSDATPSAQVYGSPRNDYNGEPRFISYITFSGPKILDVEDGESLKNAIMTGSDDDQIHVLHNDIFPTIDITGSLSSYIGSLNSASDIQPLETKHIEIYTGSGI